VALAVNVEKIISDAIGGNRRSLSKLLTIIESGKIIPTNNLGAWTLGVTGPPGVGKSTLIGKMIVEWISRGEKVAVLAVDPSSPKSGGALLGDRMRMAISDTNDLVFVRSLATRNHPGGLTSFLVPMISLLSQCGWTRIIIETVGSGQSEIRIVAFADRVLLVEGPDRGDIIQAEKAGIIELADIIAINKSDLPSAQLAADSLRNSLSFATETAIEVCLVSAHLGDGVTELVESIEQIETDSNRDTIRFRERLLSAWDSRLISHPQFNEVIRALSAGTITLDEALEQISQPTN
jgi:LAO/AO transport system kinase